MKFRHGILGCAIALSFAIAGCGDGNDAGKPPVPGADGGPGAALHGTWQLMTQDKTDYSKDNVVIEFTKDGKHKWGPYMQNCVYTFEAPDKAKTDCTKSVPNFKVDYTIKSVDAGTLVLVNPQVNSTYTLKRK